ncbi:MAG: hypothetical protein CVU77_08790 [Elusimicrobia bacterium HGW-Elusimicrobia-1]|nr:MAG: hypothetical protein CVU77_08790 [Elusimicrobia bacterium HGW-Elusimicrobia-1]
MKKCPKCHPEPFAFVTLSETKGLALARRKTRFFAEFILSEKLRFFAEFILSEKLRFFASLRMT